eukprot:CAMPEP_0172207694 /NCGR_PEP_ID=MMETSP1050-20130122/33995_1 /TAXON_ID=233186 /ORGANISM="Cryptomonas curvata, Strain CCAP979/52" /LENGTH=150 /DNA_ID=CAMNT_0012887075 /DNA_START=240 /DNA_END=690 /DNA_ORIENTATION=+
MNSILSRPEYHDQKFSISAKKQESRQGLTVKIQNAPSEADPFSNINKMQTIDSHAYVPLGPARRPATFDLEEHVAQAWQKWAPHGPQVRLRPLLHPDAPQQDLADTPKYRREHFQTDDADRPLVAQFCANNPDTLLRAAAMVAGRCDAVD